MASTIGNSIPPLDVEKEAVIIDDAPHSPKITKGVDTKILKHSHDADAAMKAFEGMNGQVIELSEERNKALLRKIDLHLMPVRLFQSIEFPPILKC